MVLTCPHCGYSVGEEPCTGCMKTKRSYICSRCHGIVPNPKYVSGIICQDCGGQVFEDPQKSTRIYWRYYICQSCGAVVPNHKFLHDHSCEGCKAPTCNKCGAYTAWHVAKNIEVCIECGAEYLRPTPI